MPATAFLRPSAASPMPDASAEMPLDAGQRAVLALGDGVSAAVLGAPGSGKTVTVIEAVRERIRERGHRPGEIVVLAASRSSATELRDRIALRVGVPTNGPLARTVNSLAFQIVRAASAELDPPVLLTGAEQDAIIAELLQGHLDDGSGPAWPDPLDADVRRLRGFRTELRDLAARCTEYGIDPARLAELGRAHDRREWVAAAEFIAEYLRVRDAFRARSFDSSELVQEAAALVREGRPGPFADLRLIVVDDAQELTRGALTLLSAFARRGVAVLAFGDPDLSTGAFRGAHPDALGRLAEYLGVPTAPPIVLGSVHRHGPGIRAVVGAVTARIGTAAAGTQRAADAVPGGAESAVRAIVTRSPAHQLDVIARTLRERHVFDGVPFSDMAVLVRGGGLLEPIARGLAALEVPTRTVSPGAALRDAPVVRAFVLALELALGRRALDADAAVELLLGPLGGLDPIALRRLRSALRRDELAAGGARTADELLVEALAVPGALAGLDTAVARTAGRAADSVRRCAAEHAAGGTVEELLWGLWERSRLGARWSAQAAETGIAADEADRHLDAVVALFAAAQRYVERDPHGSASVFLDELVGRDVAEDTLAPRALAGSVTVATPAGVIGRSFGLVVVAGVQESVWPDTRVRGTLLGAGDLVDVVLGRLDETIDARTAVVHDELRMFAQALSRAEREVLVVAVRDEDNAPSAFFSLLPDPVDAPDERHPFSLRGMTARLRRVLTTETDPLRRSQAAAELARLAEAGVPGAHPDEWYGIADATTGRGLHDEGDDAVRVSPSRMQTFETCELHWLIDRLGGSSRVTAAGVGSIVHAVAETAGDDLSTAALMAGVDERWGELPFAAAWQSELEHAKVRDKVERLGAYLRRFRDEGGVLLQAEGGFSLKVGDAVLSGTVDRVELRGEEVFIVDIKTGNTVPSAAEVAEHAQLGAYQLAFAGGAIEAPEHARLGGARLLIVSGDPGRPAKEPTQPPLDAERLAAFHDRVAADAERMGGAVFVAQVGSHCFDPFGFGNCRIHVIGQVGA